MAAIDKYLSKLAVSDRNLRRKALEEVLHLEGLDFALQSEEKPERSNHPVQNYLLLPEGKDRFPLFCAHYDSYPGSVGANDNAAALCILIELSKELKSKNICAGFAFFDGEEEGHSGAKLFEALRDDLILSAVINLDICGYGDMIAVCSKGNPKKDGISNFCDKKLLKAHDGKLVKYLPESDDICFHTSKQPVLSVAIVPKWDIKYLDALAAYGGSFLGKPPEFKMIMDQLEVMTTMHGASKDGLEWVEPEAMQRVYDYLLDAVTSHPKISKTFNFFK